MVKSLKFFLVDFDNVVHQPLNYSKFKAIQKRSQCMPSVSMRTQQGKSIQEVIFSVPFTAELHSMSQYPHCLWYLKFPDQRPTLD